MVFEDLIVRPLSKLYRLNDVVNEMPVANNNDNRYNDNEMIGIEAMKIEETERKKGGPNVMAIPDTDPMSLPEPQSTTIPWPETNEVIRYYHQDHLGSTRLITDENRNIVKRFNYYPFGEEIIADTSNKDQYKFTGKQRDQESGLDYFGARYYSSKIYRWLSVDPIIMKSNRIRNPQRLNLYTYCINNPLNLVDPEGMDVEESNEDGRKDEEVREGSPDDMPKPPGWSQEWKFKSAGKYNPKNANNRPGYYIDPQGNRWQWDPDNNANHPDVNGAKTPHWDVDPPIPGKSGEYAKSRRRRVDVNGNPIKKDETKTGTNRNNCNNIVNWGKVVNKTAKQVTTTLILITVSAAIIKIAPYVLLFAL